MNEQSISKLKLQQSEEKEYTLYNSLMEMSLNVDLLIRDYFHWQGKCGANGM